MTEDAAAEIPFEIALARIEEIVEALERGEPELAAALEQYETGVRLLSGCYAILERAERSVALLAGVDADGKPITTPFDASATHEAPSPQAAGKAAAPTPAAEKKPPAEKKPAGTRRAKPAADVEDDPLEPPF
ncbi:Exodeoxyribonuclease 7 small subunit [Aquisphaera giovannonii]|uniref:Exodeoxyribonuclease 7 small subunit n=1 Tax=Aquisphaera giovannonii TaxID=406548 RepID=A0A5B9WCD2_9BACT|nr:exodeoxyribonuclease VII small subunit [Aquisphaera giovannonii]QEH37705.1 Exodeoxyribonuclease 7 small subunit [Aquisphaera giovannonii]